MRSTHESHVCSDRHTHRAAHPVSYLQGDDVALLQSGVVSPLLPYSWLGLAPAQRSHHKNGSTLNSSRGSSCSTSDRGNAHRLAGRRPLIRGILDCLPRELCVLSKPTSTSAAGLAPAAGLNTTERPTHAVNGIGAHLGCNYSWCLGASAAMLKAHQLAGRRALVRGILGFLPRALSELS